MRDIRTRFGGPYQITSDQWIGFVRGVLNNAHGKAHYAAQIKKYADYNLPQPMRKYSPGKLVSVRTSIICGNPDPKEITTSHAERLNLSLRHFNKRFTRLTPCFSKKLDNLIHSVSLTVAYFNFCRVHSAHRQTPAHNAGFTDHTWTVEELLTTNI